MEHELVIRPAQGSDDIAGVACLAKCIWEEYYTPILGAAQVEYMLSHFQSADIIAQDIANCGYTYYMALLRGKLSGYCAVQPQKTESTLFLSKLYVAKEARGKGVATHFLELLEHRCKEEGLKTISLTVNKYNTGAIAAYQKLGFEMFDSIVTDIGGGFVMDDYVLKRSAMPL
jgi:ribosomal protein S18 acetylase RimI-like enzyme